MSVAFLVVFCWKNRFDDTPKEFRYPNDEDKAANDSEKVDKIESGLVHLSFNRLIISMVDHNL